MKELIKATQVHIDESLGQDFAVVSIDLFSKEQVEEALFQKECVYFMAQSFLPTASLDQGNEFDYDILAVDIFLKAAQNQKVKKIYYWNPTQALEIDEMFSECVIETEKKLLEIKPHNEIIQRSLFHSVRSVQRFTLFIPMSALEISQEYFTWLPHFLFQIIQVSKTANGFIFKLGILHWTLLILETLEENESTCIYKVTGGLLVRRKSQSRFEFRIILNKKNALIVLHDFLPALPWFIYKFTQALLHVWVSRSFSKYLQGKKESYAK